MLQQGNNEDGVVKIPYEPRKEFLSFHKRNTRFAVMVAHRRAGKTVACVNELIARALHFRRKDPLTGKPLTNPRYAYIGPLLKQAKKISWEYLKHYTEGMWAKKPSESELYVRLAHNNAEIAVYGADNPDSFRGQYFDGVILDEYGDMTPSLWGAVILPTLADRDGWAAFIGTFKGRNHFFRIYREAQGLDLDPRKAEELGLNVDDYLAWVKKSWFHYLLSIDDSRILSEQQKLIQRMNMEAEEWEQEYRCNPDATVKGTYYMKIITELEKKGRINRVDVSYDPTFPVDVYSDLGVSDSTALWFIQRRPDGYAILDYVEDHGKDLEFYHNLLQSKPYRYGKIFLPHDAKARTLQTGRSTIQLFIEMDAASPLPRFDRDDTSPIIRIVPRLDLQDGINAVRKILPDCWFSPRAQDGVECLRAYSREWDEDNKVFRNQPDHNWASHGSDGFRYFALSVRGFESFKAAAEQEEKSRIILPTRQTLEELFQARERTLSLSRRRV